MTRKDFELIATTIKALKVSKKARASIAQEFAQALATTNPRFDLDRFVKACE